MFESPSMNEQNTYKNTCKKAGKRKQSFQKFCQISNNHRMPHGTSSRRNDYERKINYDWPYNTLASVYNNNSFGIYMILHIQNAAIQL